MDSHPSGSLLSAILLVTSLILLGALFVAAEIALISLRESQIKQMATRGKAGMRVAALASNPNRLLAALQVGVTVTGFLSADKGFHVLVEVVEELGSDAYVYGKPADTNVSFANVVDEGAQVIVRWDPKNPPKPGQTVTVSNLPGAVHLFDATTGARIN